MKRKALIITAFYNYDYSIRIKYLIAVLKNKGYDYLVLTSNYDHRKKSEYIIQDEKVVQLAVPAYKSNLSVRRIISHYCFSKSVKKFCCEYSPDVIYAVTPPNFLFLFLKKYKKRNDKTFVICETEDLWPESIPLSNHLKRVFYPISKLWEGIRNGSLSAADYMVYECHLFESYLNQIVIAPGKTIYLTKEDSLTTDHILSFNGILKFVYLGSVNNLIDIDLIISILNCSSQLFQTELHIIGTGEKLQKMIDKCRENSISVYDHGVIYDEKKKEEILRSCHLALNIMKPSVFVGVTMKSLEYFHYGMPIINNIKGDTLSIVEQFGCGLNILDMTETKDELVRFLNRIDNEALNEMGNKSRSVYKNLFSPDSFYASIDDVIV